MKLDFGARMNIPITKHELFSTPVYEDEVFISPSSAELMKDEVLDYAYKETGISDEGLIAQEVEKLVPNAVVQDDNEYYQMDYSKLVTHLVKGMQEQQEQIESLKSEIAILKGE